MDLDEYTKALDDEVSDRKQLNLYNKTLRERIQKLQDGNDLIIPSFSILTRFFKVLESCCKRRIEKLTE